MKLDNLNKSIESLIKASNYLSNMAGENLDEAKNHINQAIKKISKENKKTIKRKEGQVQESDKWWDKIISGAVKLSESNVTKESYMRSLSELQSMIDKEQKDLDNLENIVNTQNNQDDLLNG